MICFISVDSSELFACFFSLGLQAKITKKALANKQALSVLFKVDPLVIKGINYFTITLAPLPSFPLPKSVSIII